MVIKVIIFLIYILIINPFNIRNNEVENNDKRDIKKQVYNTNSKSLIHPLIDLTNDGKNVLNPCYIDFDSTNKDILINCSIIYYDSHFINFAFKFLDNPFDSQENLMFYYDIFYISENTYKYFYTVGIKIDRSLVIEKNVYEYRIVANFDEENNILGITICKVVINPNIFTNIKLQSYLNNCLIDASIYSDNYKGIVSYEEKDFNFLNVNKSFLFNKNKLIIEHSEDLYKRKELLNLLSNMYFYDDVSKNYLRLEVNEESLYIFARKLINPIANQTYELNLNINLEGSDYKCVFRVSYFDKYPLIIEVNNLINANTLVYSYKKALTEEDLIKEILLNVRVYKENVNKLFTPNIKLDYFVPYKLGFFGFSIYVTDGINETYWNGFVDIIDDYGPIISGPKVITTSINHVVTKDEILTMYSAYDDIDKNMVIKDIYLNEYHQNDNPKTKGEYKIIISAKDINNNLSMYEAKINVLDDDTKLWYLSDSTLHIIEGTKVSALELVRRLVDENMLEDLEYEYANYVSDTQIDGTQAPGIHYITIRVETKEGVFKYLNIKVIVEENTVKEIETNVEEDIWTKIKNFFVSILNYIKKMFGIE